MNTARNHRTLSQLNSYLRQLIDEHLGGKRFWLKAEISQIKENRSGHVYLDLIEQKDGQTVAKSRAHIWNSDLLKIRHELGNEYLNVMKQGSEIMCLVQVQFSEIYGFSIQILTVDLSFNLGELERKKQETVKRLREEGLMEVNRALALPKVIQKIAVISAEGSDGLKDLMEQLEKNQYGYVFETRLFPSAVQGDKAPAQIIKQIKAIQKDHWDALLIVRGGGSKIDLDAFNDYQLCVAVAQSGIPVLTGIGHENDISVADMVAHTRLKTPSAVGAFIVERAHIMDVHLQQLYERIRNLFRSRTDNRKNALQLASGQLKSRAISITQLQRGQLHNNGGRVVRLALENLSERSRTLSVHLEQLARYPVKNIRDRSGELKSRSDLLLHRTQSFVKETTRTTELWREKLTSGSRLTIRQHRKQLEYWAGHIQNLHPNRILRRGFSITRKSDQAINYKTPLKEGDLLEIEIYKKKIFVQFLNDEPKWNELKKELDTKTPQKN